MKSKVSTKIYIILITIGILKTLLRYGHILKIQLEFQKLMESKLLIHKASLVEPLFTYFTL